MSIILNGSPTKPFKMERGLRQGDPLSPFIFVLVAEVLNKLLIKAKDLELIEGIKIRRDNVELSHLQYADDTVLFCPAKPEVVINFR